MLRRIIQVSLIAVVGLLLVMQFFRPQRTNPRLNPAASFEAVAKPPAHVATSVRRACGDCHSNETAWPWYSHVAPASWLVAQDVSQGRVHLNLSDWRGYSAEMVRSRLQEMCEEVEKKSMPPWYFRLAHPASRLNEAEASSLCGLTRATPAD